MKDYAVEDLNKQLDENILKYYQEQTESIFKKYNDACKKRDNYINNAKGITKQRYVTFRLNDCNYVGKITSCDEWYENEGFYYYCVCFGLTNPYFHDDFSISERLVTYITKKQYDQLTKKALKLITDAI